MAELTEKMLGLGSRGRRPVAVRSDKNRVKLNAEMIEAFSGAFLSPRYDNPKPVADFHRECWEMYTSDAENCVVAAPRGHAKSQALTNSYILASVLFREFDYVILLGATEEMAIGHLTDVANELRSNDELWANFGIKKILSDNKTDIVVLMDDGHQFRIIARGGEQKIRGLKWNGQRPGLLLFDDLEEDEQVESRERREKFRKWFFRAAKQSLRRGGKVRGHGTILHEDALLMRLLKNSQWKGRLYKAHKSFDDFSEILWPEQFSEETLRSIRQEFIDEGDAAGYSQEYLNDPYDNEDSYFGKGDFLEMSEKDYSSKKLYLASVDFAISKHERADYTAISIAGKDTDGYVHLVDMKRGRWDAMEIMDRMFEAQEEWEPEEWYVEGGPVSATMLSILNEEMRRRNIFLNIRKLPSSLGNKDKATKARSLQKRMRAKNIKFDKDADWFGVFENEMRKFTGYSKSLHDDQVDAVSILSYAFDNFTDVDEEDFRSDEDIEFEYESDRITSGRNAFTGY